jgi:hypothetical protein
MWVINLSLSSHNKSTFCLGFEAGWLRNRKINFVEKLLVAVCWSSNVLEKARSSVSQPTHSKQPQPEIMASQLTAAVLEAAALAVQRKSESVSIPNAHPRASDTIVSRHLATELQHGFDNPAMISGATTHGAPQIAHQSRKPCFGVNHLGGIHVAEAKASDEGTAPMFHLLAETSSVITPALLAKHHLPGILLQHGPLAIRHVTAYLIASLPGFSTIPPAKQRRMIVGALEGKGGPSGTMGEVGGVDGDVIFEKIGWGRWDARKKGDPPRPRDAGQNLPSLPVTKVEKGGRLSPSSRDVIVHSASYTESGIFHQSEEEGSHDVDMDDVMFMDEDSTDTSEDDDMTDEEDWAQMGAAALRRQGDSPITSDGWGNSYAMSPASGFAQRNKAIIIESPEQKRAREEREAVEALVKLSSFWSTRGVWFLGRFFAVWLTSGLGYPL